MHYVPTVTVFSLSVSSIRKKLRIPTMTKWERGGLLRLVRKGGPVMSNRGASMTTRGTDSPAGASGGRGGRALL